LQRRLAEKNKFAAADAYKGHVRLCIMSWPCCAALSAASLQKMLLEKSKIARMKL